MVGEFWSWLLLYPSPVLKGHIPQIYIDRFSLLVGGIHVLLPEKTASEDLKTAHSLLISFVDRMEKHYGKCSVMPVLKL